MYATYDTNALKLKDGLTTLFWASLLTLLNEGTEAYVGAVAWGVIAVTVLRLRDAHDDADYGRRLLLAGGAAWVMAVGTLPVAWLVDDRRYGVALSLVGFFHLAAVILAMSRLTKTWGADALTRHWRRALLLLVAALLMLGFAWVLTSGVGGRGADPRGAPPGASAVLLLLVPSVLVSVAAVMQSYVALWQTRAAVGRAALVGPAGEPAAAL